MTRPQTKKELLQASYDQYSKLNHLISSLSEEELSTPFDFSADEKKKEAHWSRDKNLRDVLVHLYEWHQLLLSWIHMNTNNHKQPFLPEPYTWKNYAEMNVEFWKKHQDTSLEEASELLEKSHMKVNKIIDTFTDEELFVKRHYDWTGSTSLGSYCISATSSHYDWAIRKLKAHRKNCI